MPIFKQDIKEITLPESGAKVKILKKFTYGTILKFQEKNIADETEAKMELAVMLIVDWDLTDEKKEKLPINRENINNLNFEDGNFLINEINQALAEKKTSISK